MKKIFLKLLYLLPVFLFLLLPFFTSENVFAAKKVFNQAKVSDVAVEAALIQSGFNNTTVFSGLTEPTAIRFASDGRIFVAEKSGIIKVFDTISDTTPTIFADLRSQVYNYWDRGLLSLELHPNFPTTPYVYVLYTRDAPPNGNTPYYNDACSDPTGVGCPATGRLSRLKAAGNVMTGSEEALITDWCVQYPSHTVGTIKFASDGSLYVSGGDGASFTFVDYGQQGNPCNDPLQEGGSLRSQDLLSPLDPLGYNGSIIRVNDLGQALSTNPFYGGDTKDDRFIAFGLRNPFRFTFKPNSNEIWVGDVGQGATEEVDRIENPLSTPIKNFGWPCYEGPVKQVGFEASNLPLCKLLYEQNAATAPYYSYEHDGQSTSITGTEFYTGTTYPAKYKNALFFADYSRGYIKAMLPGVNGLPDTQNIETIVDSGTNVVELQKGPNGDIFYVDLNAGEVHRLVYNTGNQPPTAIITADKTFGSIPLTVTFDGSTSSDPEGLTLKYTWDLDGNGTFGDSTSSKPTYTYRQSKDYVVSLRVTDSANNTNTKTLKISAGNRPPAVTISKPLSTLTWKVGDTIQFSGTGTDPDSGNVPAAKLNWKIIMHHCAEENPTDCHKHPLQTFTGVAGGTFIAPDHEYPSYLEVELSTTDSRGLTTTKSVNLQPQTTTITFQSNPPGLDLVLYDKRRTTPFTRKIITNGKATISAPTPQSVYTDEYKFVSWSDGGSQTHEFTANAANSTLTATYQLNTDVTWNSYNVMTNSGSPQGYVLDSRGGNQATMEFYESTNNGGVDKGSLFSKFHNGLHSDGTNHVENYWSNDNDPSYTYVGKSSVNRGYDSKETNAPQPIGEGIKDLQMHSPNSDHLTVAAFTAPKAGTYSVSNLAARKIEYALTRTSRFKVFNQKKELLANIQATDESWTTGNTSSYSLGQLQAGDKIYFALDRDGDYYWDYTEVAWSISLKNPITQIQTASVNANIQGLSVVVNGQVSKVASISAGTTYTIYAPTIQTTSDGKTAKFTSWSDGGQQQHVITARANNNVTAYYALLDTPSPIFQNGFEEGNTSVYPQGNINIAPGNTLSVKTTHPRNGNYSLEVASDGSGAVTEAVIDWAQAPTLNTIYLQTHFSLTEASIRPGAISNIIAIKNAGFRRLLYVSLGSDYKLRLYKFNPADEGYCEPDLCGKGTLLGTFGPAIPRDGSWHEIQLRYSLDTVHGAIELWLDGARIAEMYEQNTGTSGVDDINVITWGTFYSSHNISFRSYFDDFVLSDTYIPKKEILSKDIVWHSYDVAIQAGNPQGKVDASSGGHTANVDFYKSTNTNGVDLGNLFTTFNNSAHVEGFNNVETYWADGSGNAYPYVGKSTVLRGHDTNEANSPSPLDVKDLQIHPSNDDSLTVTSFVIPEDGTYDLTDLAARRVDGNPNETSRYKVFNSKKEQIVDIQTNSQQWSTNNTLYSLGALKSGDKIYFAVSRDGGYWWDATEINWTLTKRVVNP